MRALRTMWSASLSKPQKTACCRSLWLGLTLIFNWAFVQLSHAADSQTSMNERQITSKRCGHILTNTGVWSPDGEWIVYDTRQVDFDGDTIEMVSVHTGDVREVYRAKNG